MKESNLVSDRPGRFQDEGFGKSAAETHHKELALEDFAREIVDYLEDARNQGTLTKLSIVASPKLLGSLRNSMASPMDGLVAEEFHKDLTEVPIHDLAERLKQLRT